jgi:hypothetical protein
MQREVDIMPVNPVDSALFAIAKAPSLNQRVEGSSPSWRNEHK